MPRSDVRYDSPSDRPPSTVREDHIESGFIGKLQGLKYEPSGARQPERSGDSRRQTAAGSPKGARGGANQYRPDITDRASLEQIASSKNDPGNGYTKTLLCFLQLFIVSNRDQTFYFANNNTRHFAFNADVANRKTFRATGSALPSNCISCGCTETIRLFDPKKPFTLN